MEGKLIAAAVVIGSFVLVGVIALLASGTQSLTPVTACEEAGGYCASDCRAGTLPLLGGEPDISCSGPDTGGTICCIPA